MLFSAGQRSKKPRLEIQTQNLSVARSSSLVSKSPIFYGWIIVAVGTLGLIMTTSIVRLTRSAMLNVLGEDYVRTARAKGQNERVVLLKHALRSALLPIVSVTGIWIASLIGDSVLTEVVFNRPGLGKMLVGSILQRDYTALQSIMVIYAAFVVAVNLLTDLTYGWLDPRISR